MSGATGRDGVCWPSAPPLGLGGTADDLAAGGPGNHRELPRDETFHKSLGRVSLAGGAGGQQPQPAVYRHGPSPPPQRPRLPASPGGQEAADHPPSEVQPGPRPSRVRSCRWARWPAWSPHRGGRPPSDQPWNLPFRPFAVPSNHPAGDGAPPPCVDRQARHTMSLSGLAGPGMMVGSDPASALEDEVPLFVHMHPREST